jgi:hypothetical protein
MAEADEYRDLGSDRVLVLGRMRGRGKIEEFRELGNGVTFCVIAQRGWLPDSTSPISVSGGYVGLWRAGLIERVTVYPDIDDARAAAERLAQERG